MDYNKFRGIGNGYGLCVVVVGGGMAGVIAAVQAGRADVKTLLIEKREILGGTIVNGLVNAPGLFYSWNKQIIRGIGWELVNQCVKEQGDRLPDFSQIANEEHWKGQIRINPFLYAVLCNEAVI